MDKIQSTILNLQQMQLNNRQKVLELDQERMRIIETIPQKGDEDYPQPNS